MSVFIAVFVSPILPRSENCVDMAWMTDLQCIKTSLPSNSSASCVTLEVQWSVVYSQSTVVSSTTKKEPITAKSFIENIKYIYNQYISILTYFYIRTIILIYFYVAVVVLIELVICLLVTIEILSESDWMYSLFSIRYKKVFWWNVLSRKCDPTNLTRKLPNSPNSV